MKNKILVEIDDIEYTAIISDDEKFITLYDYISHEEIDILGRFDYNKDTKALVASFPMNDRQVIIGHVKD